MTAMCRWFGWRNVAAQGSSSRSSLIPPGSRQIGGFQLLPAHLEGWPDADPGRGQNRKNPADR
jgi:hypothetical protein